MDESREVIELINKLQSYFKSTGCHNVKIDLPQIVVVGAQSSGKSSVLDGLVGFSILPRGSGTVTKCPIIVQLITTPDDSNAGIEFEEFPDEERITDHEEVRQMIFDLMARNDGAITEDPIIIRVYSPDVVTLTVVDLPGIKRITNTEEPSNLERLITDLSKKYIKEKNAIILAVSPANYEICNSDGLLLAKEADPRGTRTIGVLTKLDLIDQGTEHHTRALLTGSSTDVTVELGMVGVVSRSQKDIDNNMSIEQQLVKEHNHLLDVYPDLAYAHGIPYLRKKLHELLVQHIVKCLPEILDNLEQLLEECETRLANVPNVKKIEDKYSFINKILTRFETNMRTEIEGSSRNPEYAFLYGGVKIKEAFERRFADDMDNAGLQSDQSITNKMIQTAFQNSGSFDSMFVYPEAVFRKLAQKQVKFILTPALKCADRVYEQILQITERNIKNAQSELEYFVDLRKKIKQIVHEMLDNKLEGLKLQINDFIRVQSSVVFSLNEDFLKTLANLQRELEKKLFQVDLDEEESNGATGSSASRFQKVSTKSFLSRTGERFTDRFKDTQTVTLIKTMVRTYFDLIKSQSQDYIPKLIADRLITQFSSDGSLGNKLRSEILQNFDDLIKLPANLTKKRESDEKLRLHLKEAIADIKGIINTHDRDEDEPLSCDDDSVDEG